MEEEHESRGHADERWLVSYADFITLLFALFVLLYALSNSSKPKQAAAMNSVARAVGVRPGSGSEGTRLGLASRRLDWPPHRDSRLSRRRSRTRSSNFLIPVCR